MTPEEEQEIRERCEKATPGPWRESYKGYSVKAGEQDEQQIICEVHGNTTIPEGWEKWFNNREFIAHARTDIPALLATIAELREWQKRAKNLVGEL